MDHHESGSHLHQHLAIYDQNDEMAVRDASRSAVSTSELATNAMKQVRSKKEITLTSKEYSTEPLTQEETAYLNVLWAKHQFDAGAIRLGRMEPGFDVIDSLQTRVPGEITPTLPKITRYLVDEQHVPLDTVKLLVRGRKNYQRRQNHLKAKEESGTNPYRIYRLNSSKTTREEKELREIGSEFQRLGINVQAIVDSNDPVEVDRLTRQYVDYGGQEQVASRLDRLYLFLYHVCKKNRGFILNMIKFLKNPEVYMANVEERRAKKVAKGLQIYQRTNSKEPSNNNRDCHTGLCDPVQTSEEYNQTYNATHQLVVPDPTPVVGEQDSTSFHQIYGNALAEQIYPSLYGHGQGVPIDYAPSFDLGSFDQTTQTAPYEHQPTFSFNDPTYYSPYVGPYGQYETAQASAMPILPPTDYTLDTHWQDSYREVSGSSSTPGYAYEPFEWYRGPH